MQQGDIAAAIAADFASHQFEGRTAAPLMACAAVLIHVELQLATAVPGLSFEKVRMARTDCFVAVHTKLGDVAGQSSSSKKVARE